MSTVLERQIGLEALLRDPLAGENEEWISQERYESTTPEHWQTLPVSYFRRRGNNKLQVERRYLSSDSLLQRLWSKERLANGGHGVDGSDQGEASVTSDISVHLRSDGLHLWSPSKSQGVTIPLEAIATYAPDNICLSPSSASSSGSADLPAEVYSDPVPAVRMDLIPDGDFMDTSEGGDEGFAPSMLLNLALVAGDHPEPAQSPAPAAGREGAGTALGVDDNATPGTVTPAESPTPCTDAAAEVRLGAADVRRGMRSVQQQFLTALARCQEQMPNADGGDSDGDDDDLDRRLRLPVIHMGSAGVDDGDNSSNNNSDNGPVRLAGLGNFSGWITAENVNEVMRSQGIELDADADADAGVGAGSAPASAPTPLGPGAGSRRQRREGNTTADSSHNNSHNNDGDEGEHGDGERVTIWQRTGM